MCITSEKQANTLMRSFYCFNEVCKSVSYTTYTEQNFWNAYSPKLFNYPNNDSWRSSSTAMLLPILVVPHKGLQLWFFLLWNTTGMLAQKLTCDKKKCHVMVKKVKLISKFQRKPPGTNSYQAADVIWDHNCFIISTLISSTLYDIVYGHFMRQRGFRKRFTVLPSSQMSGKGELEKFFSLSGQPGIWPSAMSKSCLYRC